MIPAGFVPLDVACSLCAACAIIGWLLGRISSNITKGDK